MHNSLIPVQRLPPFGRSDHQCLLLTAKSKQIKLLNVGNRNALSVRILLEDWTSVNKAHDIDEKGGNFSSIQTRIVHETIPEKTVYVYRNQINRG